VGQSHGPGTVTPPVGLWTLARVELLHPASRMDAATPPARMRATGERPRRAAPTAEGFVHMKCR
jgi:hypothetical protein